MSEPAGTNSRTRRLGLRGAESVVARCRDFCREALTDWDWPAAPPSAVLTVEERQIAVEDVLLLVSEAVTNACLHAGGPTELVIRLVPAEPGTPDAAVGVRIEVSDRSSGVPRLRPRGAPGRPGGNGLIVIDRLAHAWGVAARDGGKSVWMDVVAPAGSVEPPDGASGLLAAESAGPDGEAPEP
ncbi:MULTISPECIES: ATP-binding protein [unclassified Streptomyces]|uniref:ATP-binding protein n=1 Tax=unclassified Streptomyces TaxID=2593676 RepID=UPI0007C97CE4|nr:MULTISPECIES: ATP-binding protein [unclassified Streptomyces]